MSRRNQIGRQGVNIRVMTCNSSSSTRWEAYFESLPDKRKSIFEKQEYIVIKAYLETDSSGYLLQSLEDVLKCLRPTFDETTADHPEKPLLAKKRRTDNNNDAEIDSNANVVENAVPKANEQPIIQNKSPYVMQMTTHHVEVFADLQACCCGCKLTFPKERLHPHTCTTTGEEVFGSICFLVYEGSDHHKECSGCALIRVKKSKKPNQLFDNNTMQDDICYTFRDSNS